MLVSDVLSAVRLADRSPLPARKTLLTVAPDGLLCAVCHPENGVQLLIRHNGEHLFGLPHTVNAVCLDTAVAQATKAAADQPITTPHLLSFSTLRTCRRRHLLAVTTAHSLLCYELPCVADGAASGCAPTSTLVASIQPVKPESPWRAVAWHPNRAAIIAVAGQAELAICHCHCSDGQAAEPPSAVTTSGSGSTAAVNVTASRGTVLSRASAPGVPGSLDCGSAGGDSGGGGGSGGGDVAAAAAVPPGSGRPGPVAIAWSDGGSVLVVSWAGQLELLRWRWSVSTRAVPTAQLLSRRLLLAGVPGPFRCLAPGPGGTVLATSDAPLALSPNLIGRTLNTEVPNNSPAMHLPALFPSSMGHGVGRPIIEEFEERFSAAGTEALETFSVVVDLRGRWRGDGDMASPSAAREPWNCTSAAHMNASLMLAGHSAAAASTSSASRAIAQLCVVWWPSCPHVDAPADGGDADAAVGDARDDAAYSLTSTTDAPVTRCTASTTADRAATAATAAVAVTADLVVAQPDMLHTLSDLVLVSSSSCPPAVQLFRLVHAHATSVEFASGATAASVRTSSSSSAGGLSSSGMRTATQFQRTQQQHPSCDFLASSSCRGLQPLAVVGLQSPQADIASGSWRLRGLGVFLVDRKVCVVVLSGLPERAAAGGPLSFQMRLGGGSSRAGDGEVMTPVVLCTYQLPVCIAEPPEAAAGCVAALSGNEAQATSSSPVLMHGQPSAADRVDARAATRLPTSPQCSAGYPSVSPPTLTSPLAGATGGDAAGAVSHRTELAPCAAQQPPAAPADTMTLLATQMLDMMRDLRGHMDARLDGIESALKSHTSRLDALEGQAAHCSGS